MTKLSEVQKNNMRTLLHRGFSVDDALEIVQLPVGRPKKYLQTEKVRKKS